MDSPIGGALLFAIAVSSNLAGGIPKPSGAFELKSPVLSQGKEIPRQYTADGKGTSPPLSWSGIPDGTQELALVVDDSDAKKPPYTHWVLYGISPDTSGLPQSIPPNRSTLTTPIGAVQGSNSQGTTGYTPPAPPAGDAPHHYHFKLFALDKNLHLKPGLDSFTVMDKIQDHVIAETELVATYERG